MNVFSTPKPTEAESRAERGRNRELQRLNTAHKRLVRQWELSSNGVQKDQLATRANVIVDKIKEIIAEREAAAAVIIARG